MTSRSMWRARSGRLKMTYRSDPPLPTEEVFSLLALGYAPQQQEGSTSGIVSSFAAGNATQSVGESALLSQALSDQVAAASSGSSE